MQFSVLTSLAFLSAAATTVLAAPSPLSLTELEVPGLTTRQSCTYERAQYASTCATGNTVFCTGNVNVCPRGKTDTFDETATKANEDACADLEGGSSCWQTVACC